MCRPHRPDATERMLEYAQTLGAGAKKVVVSEEWRSWSVQDRLSHALVKVRMPYTIRVLARR